MEQKVLEMLRQLEYGKWRKRKLVDKYGLSVFDYAYENGYIYEVGYDSDNDAFYGLAKKGKDAVK